MTWLDNHYGAILGMVLVVVSALVVILAVVSDRIGC